MKKVIGYARASENNHELQNQFNALIKAGCIKENHFVEISPTNAKHYPVLERCIASLAEGDTLLVISLDQLGFSISDIIVQIDDLFTRGINIRSLNEPCIDTSNAYGEQNKELFTALAKTEKTLRTKLKTRNVATRARGRRGGRKKNKS